MPTRLRIVAVVGFVVLIGAALLRSGGERMLTATTFGAVPRGFGALYALLEELDLPVARSLRPIAELDAGAPVWWLAAPALCDAVAPAGSAAAALRQWLEGGGVAVVALPPLEAAVCSAVAGFAAPRAPAEPTLPAPQHLVAGPLLARPRDLVPEGLAVFAAADGWNVLAQRDGRPFVQGRRVGAGMLVLVADATVFSNRWLDRGDNAVFALDLVRAWGAPRFDEHAHGFRRHESAARYLATSPAAVVFLALTLFAALHVWRTRLLPERGEDAGVAAAPVLEAYVESLAQLLAATRDHARVADACRALAAARLRRHFGLPAATPVEEIAARLRSDARIGTAGIEALLRPPAVRDGRAVRRLGQTLERLVREATG